MSSKDPYAEMPQEDFDRILLQILEEKTGAQLIHIPGIVEILNEHFNNEILDRWEEERETKRNS